MNMAPELHETALLYLLTMQRRLIKIPDELIVQCIVFDETFY